MSISANFNNTRPALLLDFANSQQLDPRVTFSRSTTAPYYDGKTSVLAEQNLFIQSNTFSNAAWVATSATIASGVTDPAGGTTAFSMTATAGNATLYQTLTLTATAYTESIWIQRVTGTGTINLTLDGSTLSPVTITGSWAKYSYTATPSAGSRTIGIQIVTSGDAINIYGSQLENRSSATATNITTTTAITNYIPQLQTAPINTPRFDFNPTTGESLGFLIEQSSTNLLTYSQDYTNAVWTKATGCTVNNSATIAPDGTQTANSISQTTNGDTNGVYRTGAIFQSGRTVSLYLKAGEITSVTAQNGAGQQWTFNLTTGVFSSVNAVYTTSSVSVGNGWWRLQIVLGSVAGTDFFIGATSGASAYNKFYMWGFQIEALAFSTSYIATTSAQVTRASDNASMTGTNFSSWYNNQQGTLYAENLKTTSGGSASFGVASISNGTSSNSTNLYINPTVSLTDIDVLNNGATQFSYYSGAYAKKQAVSFANNSMAGSSGGTISTSSTGLVPSNVNQLVLGNVYSTSQSYQLNGWIKKLAYYPIAVTSAQLQALTGT
jgi:hypothetical protein